jgi:phosphatidylglycerophosphate synthase
MPPTSGPLLRQVPNALSTVRLVIAAMFPFIDPIARPAFVIVGAATDLVDGYIARRYGITSVMGGVLDGLADKLFVLSVLLTITLSGQLAWWQLILLLSRDLMVLPLSAAAAWANRWDALEHRPLGKITTALLFLLMLIATALPDQRDWLIALFIVASIVSIIAAVDYGAVFLRLMRQHDQASP